MRNTTNARAVRRGLIRERGPIPGGFFLFETCPLAVMRVNERPPPVNINSFTPSSNERSARAAASRVDPAAGRKIVNFFTNKGLTFFRGVRRIPPHADGPAANRPHWPPPVVLSMFPGPTDPKKMARYLALSQVGLEMVTPIILGLVLDHYLGWSPWGVIVGAILGLTGG